MFERCGFAVTSRPSAMRVTLKGHRIRLLAVEGKIVRTGIPLDTLHL